MSDSLPFNTFSGNAIWIDHWSEGRLIHGHYFLVLLQCNEWIERGGQFTGQKEIFL